jgi:hypothetical protein
MTAYNVARFMTWRALSISHYLEGGEGGEVIDEVAAVLVDHHAALLAQQRLGADVLVQRRNHLGGGSLRTSTRIEVGRARMIYLRGECSNISAGEEVEIQQRSSTWS